MLSNNLSEDYGCFYPWAYCDDVFSEKELDILNSSKYQNNLTDSVVVSASKENGISSEISDYRNSKSSFIFPTEETFWIFQKLNDVILSINNKMFKYDLFGFDKIQYTKYSANGHYKKHSDYIYGQIVKPSETPYVPMVRKLSLTMFLNEDYEGGDFVLHYDGRSEVCLEKKRGRIIFFPSDIIHEVTEVTSGERRSIVVWVMGPPWK